MSLRFYFLSEVEKEGLIQLTEWANDTEDENNFIESEITRIMKYNKERICKPVRKGLSIALFVNDIAYCKGLKQNG